MICYNNFTLKKIIEFLKYFLPFLVLATALCGLSFVLVQQSIRQGAYDPQVQVSEEITNDLSAGRDPKSLTVSMKTDVAKSLAPYIIIFDDQGKEVASSVQLDGKTPTVPGGVFEYVRLHGQDRFTWQPKVGIRSAVVVSRYKSDKDSGFILVGRSMREVENRIERILKLTGLAWLVTVGALFVVCGFFTFLLPKKLR